MRRSGGSEDRANGIAIDGAGSAYITGETGSENFLSVNAFQPNLRAQFSSDAFIAQITQSESPPTSSTPAADVVNDDRAAAEHDNHGADHPHLNHGAGADHDHGAVDHDHLGHAALDDHHQLTASDDVDDGAANRRTGPFASTTLP